MRRGQGAALQRFLSTRHKSLATAKLSKGTLKKDEWASSQQTHPSLAILPEPDSPVLPTLLIHLGKSEGKPRAQ